MTDMWVPVLLHSSRRGYTWNLRRMPNCQDHKIKRYVDTDRNSNLQRTRQKREEKKFQLKRSVVKFHATNVTCNSGIFHHQVLTCNMQNIHQARSLRYNCHVSINVDCEYTVLITISFPCTNHILNNNHVNYMY